MSPRALSLLTTGSALGCGLVAGVFFAFSTFVMRGLSSVPAPCAGIVAGREVVLALPVRGCVSNTLVDRATGRRCNVWCE